MIIKSWTQAMAKLVFEHKCSPHAAVPGEHTPSNARCLKWACSDVWWWEPSSAGCKLQKLVVSGEFNARTYTHVCGLDPRGGAPNQNKSASLAKENELMTIFSTRLVSVYFMPKGCEAVYTDYLRPSVRSYVQCDS